MTITEPEALTKYCSFGIKIRKQLVSNYGLSPEEDEWLEEMIIPDALALESLNERMQDSLDILLVHESEKAVAVQNLLSHLLILLVNYSNGGIIYDARLRAFLKTLASSLLKHDLDSKKSTNSKSVHFILSLAETDVIGRIASNVSLPNSSASDVSPSDDEDKNIKKWAGIGIATVAGGILCGVTGGLAIPFIAGGLSSLGVAGAGLTAFGSVASAAIVGSTLGVAGAGVAGFKISKHFSGLDEFYFTPITNVSPGLCYTIAISGWINTLDDALVQWEHLGECNPLLEVNVLQFDRKELLDLTTAGEAFIKTNLISYGVYGAAVAATGSLAVAVSFPITAFTGLGMLDNPLNLALSKCETAGIVLARNVLSNYEGGNRPVTLIGHGMGARTIVFCLLELYAMRDEIDIYAMVDSVYLLGACVSLSKDSWEQIVPIAASRFVNCYSDKDWFLKFLFRISLTPAAGVAPIQVDGITNADVSSLVNGHGDYIQQIDDLLAVVGFEKL